MKIINKRHIDGDGTFPVGEAASAGTINVANINKQNTAFEQVEWGCITRLKIVLSNIEKWSK